MTLGLLPTFTNTAALRYFYEAAQYSSFRNASEKIRIAPSAISRQVQLLEKELNTKLFTRHRDGLHLTGAGEALLARVKRAMEELKLARHEIDVLRTPSRCRIRLGLNDTIAREFFSDFFREFSVTYPDFVFDLKIANSDELASALSNGELDAMIGYAVQPHRGLKTVCSFELKHCVMVRPDHRLAKRSHVRISDIADERFIMPPKSSALRQAFDSIFASAAAQPSVPITANSFEFIALLVSEGIGISFQLRMNSGLDRKRNDLRYLQIEDPRICRAVLACCVPEGSQESALTAACIEHLKASLETWRSATFGSPPPPSRGVRDKVPLYA